MYIVELTGDKGRVEKEFVRKGNAVKAAAKALNDGFVYFDNSELWKYQRYFKVSSARIYSTDDPTVVITI